MMTPADAAFARLAERYLDEVVPLSPVGATRLGDHRFDAELDDVSPAARDQAAKIYRALLADVRKIPKAGLARANQVDRQLLIKDLEHGLFELEEVREWAWNPLVYTNLAGGALYGLIARDYAPLPRRLEAAASRMEKLPRFFEQVRRTLEPARVPRVHAETAVQQNPGTLSIVTDGLRPAFKAAPPKLRARLEKAAAALEVAVKAHQAWLEKTLLPAAKADFRLGADLWERRLSFVLDSPLGRAEIRKRAEAELERVHADMLDASRKVLSRWEPAHVVPRAPTKAERLAAIRAALEVVYRDLPDDARLVEVAREALRRTTDFVREKRLLSLPDDPIEIIVMPEFERGVAIAYCDSPGPLESPSQRTFYAVAPLPAAWTADQKRSFLREYNLVSVDDLSIHEAMPGHHVQIAHANRYPSKLRALLASGSFIEGWAVYAERLMVDAGYRADDSRMRLVQLKWYLRSVTNALMDQDIHAGKLSEAEAMKLMTEQGFQQEREAAGKWRRALVTATQLSTYFVGYQEHADLRAAAEKRAGKGFDPRAYHDRLLSFGSPPGRFARALVLDEPIPE